MTNQPDKPRAAIVDPFPVAGLAELYRSKDGVLIKKSALNDRMTALGIKSFAQPGQGSKRFIRAADVLRLNTLDAYIHENGTVKGFPGLITASSGDEIVSGGSSLASTGDDLAVFDEELGELTQAIQSESRLTTGNSSSDMTLWQALTQMSVQDAIGRWTKPLQTIFYPSHKKTEDAIRTFSLAVEKEAVLSTSQIADLLNVGTGVFSGKKSVTRMGFKFVRLGKEGREAGWRVSKAKLPPIELED